MSENWPRVPLGEVLTRSAERITLHPETLYREVTVRLWGKGVTTRREVLGAEITATDRFRCTPNQFIVSRIDARNGAFGLIPPELAGAVVTNDFPLFNVNTARLAPKFLGWLCKTAGFVELCKAASEGTTNRVRLKEEKFKTMPVHLPPLAEQRLIVARVEALATRIASSRQHQEEVLADLKHLLMAKYSQLAENTLHRPMAEVAPLVRRKVAVKLTGNYPELGIRCFGKGTFHKPALTGAEVDSKKLFEIHPGDLVFSNVFAWEGAIAVAQPEDVGRFGSHRFITCVPIPSLTTSQFLWFYFQSPEGAAKIQASSPGGAGRNRTLGIEALAKITVPVPPIEKQREFDALQAKADSLRLLQSESAAELDALLPSVLAKAFAGRL